MLTSFSKPSATAYNNISEALMELSCNNHSSGSITISGGNHGEIINGASNGCTGGNYHNSSSSSSGSGGHHHRHLQELVVFTGKLTNEPRLINHLQLHPIAFLI